METRIVIGVDEVGVGCLAGPVVAVAYYFSTSAIPPQGLTDSKKLSQKRRQELLPALTSIGHLGVGHVTNADIDKFNVHQATLMAMKMAIESLRIPPEDRHRFAIIIDGQNIPALQQIGWGEIRCEPKADANHAAVSAASVIAKEHRDALMIEMSKVYDGYGFEKHAGYGTEAHLGALATLGPCAIHRKSFSPIAKLLPHQPSEQSDKSAHRPRFRP